MLKRSRKAIIVGFSFMLLLPLGMTNALAKTEQSYAKKPQISALHAPQLTSATKIHSLLVRLLNLISY